MNEDFGYDDVIEVEAEFHGAFPFVRVIEQSGLVRSTSILSQAAATNPKLATLLDEVVQAGGYWERAFGGALFIALPPNAGIDVNAALASL